MKQNTGMNKSMEPEINYIKEKKLCEQFTG